MQSTYNLYTNSLVSWIKKQKKQIKRWDLHMQTLSYAKTRFEKLCIFSNKFLVFTSLQLLQKG